MSINLKMLSEYQGTNSYIMSKWQENLKLKLDTCDPYGAKGASYLIDKVQVRLSSLP